MPFKVVSGAGVGAAAFVVGLALAGPQALGVASADTAAADSTAVSAEPGAVSGDEGSPARSAAGRGGRGVKPSESTGSRVGPRASADATSARQTPAGEAARRSVRGSVSARPVAAVADRRNSVAVTPPGLAGSVPSAPSVPVVMSGVPEVAVPVPSAAAVVADPARVPARAQRGVSTRAAVRPPDLTSVATVNAQINSGFDSLANLLTGLPQGPVADFLGGALLLARRSLFNQAPTAAPVQYGQTETDIVGTLGAVDVEGNPITYIVSQAPQHGTVSIDADGFYTYIPTEFATTDSTDSFTVSVADSAIRLLGPISTNVVVPVSINGVPVSSIGTDTPPSPPTLGRVGITVFNWSQYSVQLEGIGGDRDELNVRPADGTVVTTGHSFYYVLNTGNVFSDNVVTPRYRILTGDNNVRVETEIRSSAEGTNTKIINQQTLIVSDQQGNRVEGVRQYLLDPPNTTVTMTGPVGNSALINWICRGGGPAKCSYNVKSQGREIPDAVQVGTSYSNLSDISQKQTYSASYLKSFTESVTNSYEINAGLKVTFIKDVLEGTFGGKWAQSFTNSSTQSWTYTSSWEQASLPWTYNVLLSYPRRDFVTGDVAAKLGNTTFRFTDVTYSIPSNSDCAGEACKEYKGAFDVVSGPLQEGFKLQDEKNRLPNSPVYVLGGETTYPLKLTAYNGAGGPSGDFTVRTNSKGELVIRWTTDNADVATVSPEGVITIKAEGKANIIATYQWEIDLGKKAKYGQTITAKLPITVKAPNPAPAA